MLVPTDSSLRAAARAQTIGSVLRSLSTAIVYSIASVTVLGELGINLGPIVASAGIAGVAIGFGAQSLVKDYFNGALILIENQYGRGDVVQIAGVQGTVEDLTLRRTTLRDFDGNVHTVPNSAIIVASNLTRGWARINEEIQVPSADLVDDASEVVDRVGREMASDPAWHRRLLEPPHVERIDALGPSGITLTIAGRVEAAHRWTATGELRRRLLEGFRSRGLPFVPSGPAGGAMVATGAAGTAATGSARGSPPSVPSGSAALDTTPRAPAGPGQDDLAQGTD